MEREKISTFIEKVFEKTHSEQLYWSVIDKKDNLYKPTSIEENCPFYSSNDFHELDNRYSYFSKYKNGYILLLAYRDNKIFLVLFRQINAYFLYACRMIAVVSPPKLQTALSLMITFN